MKGNNNYFQTDWGAGRGEVGGLGLSYLNGDNNKFNIPNYGTSKFERDIAGSGIAVFEGSKNIITKSVELKALKERICREFQINIQALEGGSRKSEVSHVRAIMSYVWVSYLGRSGRQLARELGVSPQAVYSSSARIESDGALR